VQSAYKDALCGPSNTLLVPC